MTKHIRRIATPLALTCALFAGACKNDRGSQDTTLAADSSLNRDLSMAGRDSAAQPQLTDTAAATPAPANTTTTAPAPAKARPTTSHPRTSTSSSTPTKTTTASGNTVEKTAAGSEGNVATIPAGSSISFASDQRVCTNTNKVGDTFTATTSEPVTVGSATIPAGATANVKVTQLKRSENANDNVVVGLAVTSIAYGGKTYPVDANVAYAKVDKVRNSSKGNDAKKVIGGAIAGAILGQAIGKDTKGTVIGGAAGAAAGTAAAAATANYEGCVPQGGKITIQLNSAAQIASN
jgi:hypothetical protein